MSSDIKLDFQDYAPSKLTSEENSASKVSPSKSRSDEERLIGSTPIARSETSKFRSSPNAGRSSEQQFSGEKLRQSIGPPNKLRSYIQQLGNSPNSGRVVDGGWGLSYLSQYFDVTTSDVIERIIWSIVPFRKKATDVDNFPDENELFSLTPEAISNDGAISSRGQRSYSYVERFIQSRPDLYGPTWISITMVFAIVVFSNLVSFNAYHRNLNNRLMSINFNLTGPTGLIASEKLANQELDRWHYSLDQLNLATSLVMFYVLVLPSIMWLLFWFRGCQKYYTIIEIICAYGYSLSVFVALTALLVYQELLFRYAIMLIASSLSGSVLTLSFLPIVETDPNPTSSHLVLAIVPFCQLTFAYFLHRVMLY